MSNHERGSGGSWRTPLVALGLSCIMACGTHFGKHSLASLGPDLLQAMDLNRKQFGLMFSFQEVPGVILPLYAGFLVSAISLDTAAVLLTALSLLGQILVTIAAFIGHYGLLLAGRLVFGLGDGALVVLQGSIIGIWFATNADEEQSLMPQETRDSRPKTIGISTAFGLMILVSRLSSLVALSLPAIIAKYVPGGFRAALVAATFVCGGSFAAGLAFRAIFGGDRRSTSVSQTAEAEERGLLSRIRELPTVYWTLVMIWLPLSASFFSFVHFATDMLTTRYDVSKIFAGLMSSYSLVFAAVSSPVLGTVLDRFGRRPAVLIAASSMMLVALVNMSMSRLVPILLIDIGLLGIGFAQAPVTLLSSVALVTSTRTLAVALGLFKCVENLGLVITHGVTGSIVDSTGSYTLTLVFFSILSGVGLFFSLLLLRNDQRTTGVLSQGWKSPPKRPELAGAYDVRDSLRLPVTSIGDDSS